MRLSLTLVAAILPLSFSLVEARAPRPPHIRRLQAGPRRAAPPMAPMAPMAARQFDDSQADVGVNITSVSSAAASSAITSESWAASITASSSSSSSSPSSSASIAAIESAAPSSSSSSESSTTAASASSKPVVLVTSTASTPVTSSIVPSAVTTSSATVIPSTAASTAAATTSTVVQRVSTQKNTVVTKTSTASASATNAADKSSDKVGALSKPALIAIIVVASVIGLAAIIVFAIRKCKLRKSRRFDDRLRPIDFSPGHDAAHDDDFIEKTLYRSASNASADRQRQQFVKDLEADPNHVDGVPQHDFTAAPSQGYATYDDMYTNDPFAHAQSYQYPDGPIAYPPTAVGAHIVHGHPQYEYPTQDSEGYADVQRANSAGSGGGLGHVHGQDHGHDPLAGFPSPENYIRRPTGGSDGRW